MKNKSIFPLIVGGVFFVGVAMASGLLDGPLTVEPHAQNSTVGSASSGKVPNSSETQSASRLGGAPVATATNGEAVNNQLPPVVDAVPGPGMASPATINDEGSSPHLSPPSSSSTAESNAASVSQSVQSTAVAADNNSNLTANQRLSKVEQQLSNIVHMNLPQQVNDIQMQLQQLSGQLQVQEHDLKLLNIQQRNFYQDLDQRIRKISGSNSDDSMINNGDTKKPTPSQSNPSSGKGAVNNSAAENNIELQDSNAYKAALDLVVKRRYDDAIKRLNKYINVFPNGEYVGKAHYWLGEIYYLKKSYKKSLQAFSVVVNGSPKSPRVPDALYKIALIHAVSGKIAQAKKELRGIQRRFPNSAAAQLATIQLKRFDL